MLFSLVRIILVAMLVVSFSGLATTASALIQTESAVPCCAHEGGSEKTGEVPCAVPDCSCVSCMVADLNDVLTVSSIPASKTTYYPSPQNLHLSSYIRSIDYPPETF